MVKNQISLCACVMAVGLMLSGCVNVSAENVGSSPDHIWIKLPIIGERGVLEMAQEHCAQFDKEAALEEKVFLGQGLPMNVYTCE